MIPIRKLTRWLIIALLGAGIPWAGGCASDPGPKGAEVRRVIVYFDPAAMPQPPPTLAARLAQGKTVVLHYDQALSGGFFRYTTPPITEQALGEALRALTQRPDIRIAEPDRRTRTHRP
jgi:hypothetical protein